MNDLYYGIIVSLIVHGGAFCLPVNRGDVAHFDVVRAPSSVEVSIVSRKALPQKKVVSREKQVKKPKDNVPKKQVDRSKKEQSVDDVDKKEEVKETLPDKRQGAIIKAKALLSKNAAPQYPRVARERGYEGDVLLEVAILSNGTCNNIRIIKSSGYRLLDRAAIKAVRKWEFTPAERNGKPFISTIQITVVFTLADNQE